ncbi:hypothetical protein HO133_005212 [Letharia lupina]|uniref:Uncharacterized protein n=1 Tax=Letharia lupina TaxID=560253 RepID=A0A8H6CA36_9LECA|nr:uncharacterized protein HO133_005212 [Letharia lupina]KAF6219386.1 hypothetical protein HO133_005212 [Letharia lupina]
MARTWFAGPPTAQTVPPSKNPKGAVSKKGDPAQSNEGVLSKNQVAVNDFATAHQITPTKAIHSDSELDGSVTWATPFSSPEKELKTQPAKEAIEVIEASANLAKLIQQHSKPKDPQGATPSEEPTTSRPVETMNTFTLSSSAPRRAPIAQMVPLSPNVAVTTTPAATADPVKSTTSLFGPCPSPTNVSSPQACFPVTAPSSLRSSSILPSSPTASAKKAIPTKFTSKNPQITLTPAPATAPSAFKDAALAAHVQNRKLLSPVTQQPTGVKKRQHIRTSSPPKSALTPESVPEGKPRRGRPRTRPEVQPPHRNRQYRPPIQPSTPSPQTGVPNRSNSSQFAPSAFPLQQQQAVTFNINGDSKPSFCSEEPRLWPGRGDYVGTLLHFDSKPETIHSEPIQACTNHAAHQDPHEPPGHGVCATCHHGARRSIKATRPELFGPAWWPLCKACGDNELLHTDPKKKGCSCGKQWLCFACQTQELERRTMKNCVEAEFRRRTFIGKGMDGDVETVVIGWACECGGEIGPNATLVKCIGCQGLGVGKIDSLVAIARESALMKTALAWT